MRKVIPVRPRHKKQRIVTKFLLLPLTLQLPDSDLVEKRWLETTSWIEEWYSYDQDNAYAYGEWNKIEWTDNREHETGLFFQKWTSETDD